MIGILIAVLAFIFGAMTLGWMVASTEGVIKVDGEFFTVRRLKDNYGIDAGKFVAGKIKERENLARALRFLAVSHCLDADKITPKDAAEALSGPLGDGGPVIDDRRFLGMATADIMKELGLNAK